MEKFAAYVSLKHLGAGPLFALATGKVTADGPTFLLKTPASGPFEVQAAQLLQAEFDLLHNASLPERVPAVHRLQGNVLELEMVSGIPLSDFISEIPDGRCSLKTGLTIAKNLSLLLLRLRQHRILHLALHPSQILVNPDNHEIALTGFGLEKTDLDITQITPFLPYISPEQTGRVDRKPDYRSDLYSLGAIFYEIFTGQTPFPDQDKMGLIHSHLARLPVLPMERDARINPRLSGTIMRLLAKNPGDRFPSAASLLNQLEQAELDAANSHPDAPNARDKDRFQLSDELYGRTAMYASLEEILNAASQGAARMLVLSGNSGVGKSALVYKLGRQLNQMGGFFAAGKFEQFNRSTPFIALLSAFQHLLNRLLTLEDQELERWRERLRVALGANAPVVANLLPEIELIIGKQAKLPIDEAATELTSRLKKVMKDFLRLFAAPDKPLLLFLDDLQWADSASFDLLRSLLLTDPLPHIMLVGAYRDKVAGPTHALHAFLADCRQTENFVEIALGPLDETAVMEMLCDVLLEEPEAVANLARIVFQKSAGNAFFAREFIRRLYRTQLIQYDYLESRWTWEETEILQTSISGSAVELMVEIIETLPETDQRVLKYASFFAGEFNETILLSLFDMKADPTRKALTSAAERGLILPVPHAPKSAGRFHFAHDLVQQAAYEMMPETDRSDTHFRIADYYARTLDGPAAQEKAFEIIFHYSHKVDGLQDEAEKIRFCELSLEAARKSKAGAAWEQALAYLDEALGQVTNPAAQEWYSLWFNLILMRYEAQAALAQIDAANATFQTALGAARSRPEKARLYLAKARIHIARTEMEEVLDACIHGLQLLDVKVPRKAGTIGVLKEFLRTQWMLRGKSHEDLVNLPLWEGLEGKYMGELLYLSLHPTYVSYPALYGVFCLKALQVTLKRGANANAYLGFSTYGIFLAVGFNQFEKTYQFLQTGIRISERQGEFDSTMYTSVAFSKSFGGHLRDAFPWFEKAFQYSDERGLLREATEPLTLHGINQYHAGMPLDQVESNVRKYQAYARRSGTEHLYNSILVVRYNVLRMQGRSELNLEDVNGKVVDAPRLQEILFDTVYLTIRAYHNFMQMQQAYLLGETDRAFDLLQETLPIAHSVAGAFSSMEITFYKGLILAKRLHVARGLNRSKLMRQVRRTTNKIGKWAKAAPANYAHREFMLRAELALAARQPQKALKLLDKAIVDATEHQFLQNAAIARERAGQICQQMKDLPKATAYLTEALQGFQKWGATLKVNQLIGSYQLLLQSSLSTTTVARMQSAAHTEASPDVISLLKASRIISGEISLNGLLSHLIRILIENAGAERGVLLIENDGELQIQASGTADDDNVEILHSQDNGRIPRSIVNYVSRSRKTLVLDDATIDPEFGEDPYIQEFRPRSVLCHPIVNQSKLSGILYLENNLTTGGFPRERLAVLDILAAQAAISIENALLYDDLEERVDVRTRELKKTLKFLQTTQDQLVQSEKLASLGQVTAGIAHEIRNPLNFVTNFSELSIELAEELRELVDEMQGKMVDAEAIASIREYLNDLKSNSEKIRRHGKRAESIVNNMLLHAASGTDEMQLVDFNKLTKEYALLAYHGIRGRMTSFSCNLDYDFDPEVGEFELRQQDISRALLNIFQNAFQAMEEKLQTAGADYKPHLSVTSSMKGDNVELRILDNGSGIPQEVLDHIFEPFFTTKPTGKGTGLGLSLAYDLIVQGHHGSLQVESNAGESTEFVIGLPTNI